MHDDYHTITVVNLIFYIYGRTMLAIPTLLHMDYLGVDMAVHMAWPCQPLKKVY
jgi:hypothetical protein